MTLTINAQIETVALWIAEGGLAFCESEAEEMAYLRKVNEDGWTMTTSTERPDWVGLFEGVHLSDTDLRAGYLLGIDWLTHDAPTMTVQQARDRALRPRSEE